MGETAMALGIARSKATVGVIVGRFQVPFLHEVHEALIRLVTENHPKTKIFLGLSPSKGTMNNPLDYAARKQMILELFKDVDVFYIEDCRSDAKWSAELDRQISKTIGPADSVLLYGGRDSFIKHYTGKFDVQELESDKYISGTELRRLASQKTRPSADFRAGAIWAVNNRYPAVIPTVDVAVFNEDYSKMLVARKADEKEYRLIGGFCEPTSKTNEEDARREVTEEAGGIEVGDMVYLGNYPIDDWRFRGEVDKVRTTLFATKFVHGRPEGADDVVEVRWVNLKLNDGDRKDTDCVDVPIVDEHVQLVARAYVYALERRAKLEQ
jgi:bifunctional NMN adenylyltransferase/nudix hydrolase